MNHKMSLETLLYDYLFNPYVFIEKCGAWGKQPLHTPTFF